MNTYLDKVISLANPNKYTKYYCRIIESALIRPQDRKLLKGIFGYVESHHILPESFGLGGEKDKENLVFLTAKEHFIVHLCATKMFESVFKNKMVFAFRQLRSSNKYQEDRYVNARLYAAIKPNYKSFVRLYKGREIKYLYEIQEQEILELEVSGWSREMSEDYKNNCMGTRMSGKKHSDETRQKMSNAQKGVPKIALRGRSHSQERVQKQKDIIRKNKEENPEKYQEIVNNRALKLKTRYEKGELSKAGEKNGMFGKCQSEETKQKLREKSAVRLEKINSDPVKKAEMLEKMSLSGKKSWDSEDAKERRKRISITSSSAYQKYGMHPKDFYDQKLRPLLYLGFLPTAIVKYKLLDICATSIKSWIKRYGEESDMAQFNENKKKGAGTNRAYVQFQEDQYNKYFKDKIESIPSPVK